MLVGSFVGRGLTATGLGLTCVVSAMGLVAGCLSLIGRLLTAKEEDEGNLGGIGTGGTVGS
jgi:hypothetical protein